MLALSYCDAVSYQSGDKSPHSKEAPGKDDMEKDRRSAPRVRVKLPARWEGVLSREGATVTDLSRSGCFVLTGGKVEVKELVWLEIQLTDQQTVNFWAEVVDQASEIGFALKFNSSSPEDEAALAKFLEGIFQSQGQQTT